MVSRAAGKALAIIGVILLLAGLGGIGYASLPAGDQGTFSLDPGADLFVVDSWGVLAGGTVQGTFTVANGTPISVFVYDQTDYNAYVNGANLSGLYSTTGSSGSLSVNVPGYGTYYVVFQHASGYESQGQDVSVDLTFTGLDPTFFIGGTIGAVAGVALLVVGVRRLRTPQPAAPPWSVPRAGAPPSSSWGSTPSSGPTRVPPVPDSAASRAPSQDPRELRTRVRPRSSREPSL